MKIKKACYLAHEDATQVLNLRCWSIMFHIYYCLSRIVARRSSKEFSIGSGAPIISIPINPAVDMQ